MRIWVVSIGEALPFGDGVGDRLHRMGAFAQHASNHGNDVTWWTSTFDHYRKEHLFDSDTTVRLNENLEVRLLRGPGYSRNVSIARIKDHRFLAEKFARAAETLAAPDIILASFPTMELSAESARYGRERGVPVVLDMRDMWPDIFANAVPPPLKWIVPVLTISMVRQQRIAFARASAIIGVTDAFVDWGVGRAGRSRSALDRAFPQAYSLSPASSEALQEAEEYWDARGLLKGDFIITFIGNLGIQLKIMPILEAAASLHKDGFPGKFVICGTGENLEAYRKAAANLANVYFPGWVNRAQILALLGRTKLGLDPLPNRFDFLSSINNKAVEYLSAGVPIISSPSEGVVFDLLKTNGCGASYAYGSSVECASLISYLFRRPEELERMSRSALSVFYDQFEAERVFSGMLEHLERVVRDHKPRPDLRESCLQA